MTPVTTERAEGVVFQALIDLVEDESLVRSETTFEELKIDSLDLVEVQQIVEEELGIRLLREDLKELRTVGDVVTLVVGRA